MTRDILLWSGILFQGAGLAALARLGAFRPGGLGKGSPAVPRARGLPLFLAGAGAVAVFAVMERHFLLVAAETVAAFLVCMGVRGGRRGSGDGR